MIHKIKTLMFVTHFVFSRLWKKLVGSRRVRALAKKVPIPERLKENEDDDLTEHIKKEFNKGLEIGQLVRHITVIELGIGVIYAKSEKYKGFYYVKWSGHKHRRNYEIDENYLTPVSIDTDNFCPTSKPTNGYSINEQGNE